ncbi:MAG: hypothetical protein KC609_23555 [Myxococcales bacterium]|nr:hypothetical protein [Myxococcales bacterium]
MKPKTDPIERRLRVFCDAGLIPTLPTAWQIQQGELEMLPYVISTDATMEERYVGALLGHPWLRQPLIASQVGRDHFRTGSGLECRLESVCAHLHFTFHQGMPVFDLQLVQTHPDGLTRLRRQTEELIENRSAWAKRRNRLVGLILPRAAEYYADFLGPEGTIARAERFEYPSATEAGVAFPDEFFSLVGFINHCATLSSERPAWPQLPAHVLGLLGRRFREGKRFGWFQPHEAQ